MQFVRRCHFVAGMFITCPTLTTCKNKFFFGGLPVMLLGLSDNNSVEVSVIMMGVSTGT